MLTVPENVTRATTNRSSDRSFGLVMAAFFMIVGIWPLFYGGAIRGWSIMISLTFALLSFVRPAALSRLNRAWFKLGWVLHRVTSPIILGLMFYGVITPLGLLRRVFVRDPMKLRFEPEKRSYWVKHDQRGTTPESLTDQF
ncbi:MAG TPA: SxtJ family membrane protein [Burkholderiales bacterium]|nr:SxtJ family membrane protein [Burkholderiales bacterium]